MLSRNQRAAWLGGGLTSLMIWLSDLRLLSPLAWKTCGGSSVGTDRDHLFGGCGCCFKLQHLHYTSNLLDCHRSKRSPSESYAKVAIHRSHTRNILPLMATSYPNVSTRSSRFIESVNASPS